MKRPHLMLALVASLAAVSACDRDATPTDAAGEGPGNAPPATTALPDSAPERAEDTMTSPGGAGVGVVDDAAITARVKAALMGDPTLGGLAIDVDSAAGVVTLKGQVASAAARDRAGIVAKETEGVVAIDNQLTVSSGS